jgi:tetrahydromethanopterin S-methyltransferase subunit A
MRQNPDILETLPPQAAPALNEIARGMKLKKCRICGCMKDTLDQAGRVFAASEEPKIRSLVPLICGYQAKMEPLAYDCLGCKKCWGADAIIALGDHFDEVEIEPCGGDDERTCGCSSMAAASVETDQGGPKTTCWPPYPGDYVVGNPDGTVAVCTLSDRDLPRRLIAGGGPAMAIAGRCDTENIGIEKVVLNLLATPNSLVGRLAHVIEGRQAALIAATVVERGLVTQLDHAAYLGRELQKSRSRSFCRNRV